MILEVRQWPVSQDIMDDKEWFFIDDSEGRVGDSAYAKDITEEVSDEKSFLISLLGKRQRAQYMEWLEKDIR